MSNIDPQLQFDPALKELLLRKTGYPQGEPPSEGIAVEEIPVVARLFDPTRPVPGLITMSQMGPVVTGRVALSRIVEVRVNPNVASLKASRVYGPALAFSVPEIRASQEVLRQALLEGVTGRGVVIGFADWGLDFAHANFRDKAGGTRLLYLWDQRGGLQASSPEPYCYGREFNRDQINLALASPDPYTTLGYDPIDADPLGNGTHATHVVDIAAGNGNAPSSSPGVAPEAEIIFVHLKGEDTQFGDTLGDSVRLFEAIRYIVDRAGERPVVINLSLGRTIGPHDGKTLVEMGLDALLGSRRGLAIVMSGGNYFTADMHSSGKLRQGEHVDLQWRATPQNDEIAEMEIWYDQSDAFTVELIDPMGRSLTRVALGEDRVIRESDRIVASIYHRRRDPNNGDNNIDIFLWADAMVGTWVVRLYGDNVADGTYHAWIERDDPVFQSHFTPDCATPTTTTGTICNGRNTITVGAYDARQVFQPIVPFSSAGPTRDLRQKPDLSAPGAGIRAARSSRPVNGVRDLNGTTVKSGTSMGAPHVSGTIALMFEAAGSYRLSVDETKNLLISTARQSPPYHDVDRLRYGAGRVDAVAAVKAVRELVQAQIAGNPLLPSEGSGVSASSQLTALQMVVDENVSTPEDNADQNQVKEGEASDFAETVVVAELPKAAEHDTGEDIPLPVENKAVDQLNLDESRLREQLRSSLAHMLVELGDVELHRVDERGLPIYDKRQPLLFAPTGRRYSLTNGQFNYHAADFVYNTAYQLGYEVPVHPAFSVNAIEGHSYNNTAATFAVLAGKNGQDRDYWDRFFEIVVPPGDTVPTVIREGDLLLRGMKMGTKLGYIGIISDATLRNMADPFFLSCDTLTGKGVQCIDAAGAIHTRASRFGCAVADEQGRMLSDRMVIRFKASAIDLARVGRAK